MEVSISAEEKRRRLFQEVQAALIDNVLKAIRVGGGISEKGTVKKVPKGKLATDSGLSDGTITKFSTVDYEDLRPDLETLCKLGCGLNVSPAFLLMTPSDWDLLYQAIGTIASLQDPDNEQAQKLRKLLGQITPTKRFDEAVTVGVDFVKKVKGNKKTKELSERQLIGILAMTAMTQSAAKRKREDSIQLATALGSLLGDRELIKD